MPFSLLLKVCQTEALALHKYLCGLSVYMYLHEFYEQCTYRLILFFFSYLSGTLGPMYGTYIVAMTNKTSYSPEVMLQTKNS